MTFADSDSCPTFSSDGRRGEGHPVLCVGMFPSHASGESLSVPECPLGMPSGRVTVCWRDFECLLMCHVSAGRPGTSEDRKAGFLCRGNTRLLGRFRCSRV